MTDDEPRVPTEPGFYVDSEDDLWILGASGVWQCWDHLLLDFVSREVLDEISPKDYLPFRRFVLVQDMQRNGAAS